MLKTSINLVGVIKNESIFIGGRNSENVFFFLIEL